MVKAEGKEGHTCFGCCCDVRRATIVVNALSLFGTFLILIIVGAAKKESQYADGEVKEELDGIASPGVFFYVVNVFHILFSVCGILGAMKLNLYMIAVAAMFHGINMIYNTYLVFAVAPAYFSSSILALLYLYPHLFLLNEVRSGIMTMENYRTKEQESCCCV